MSRLELTVEDAAGNQLGAGPVVTSSEAQIQYKLDGAGQNSGTMPASDPNAALLHAKRYLRTRARLGNGPIADLGVTILDSIPTALDGATDPTVKFTGNDLLDELNNWSVRGLALQGAGGAPVADGLQRILSYAPGWSLDTSIGHATTLAPLYYQFAGETALAALVKVAQLTGEHFRLGTGRQIVWLGKDRAHSGLHAVLPLGRQTGALPPQICAIKSITRTYESHELVFKLFPFGSGNASARLTLYGTTRTVPSGFELHTGPGLYDNYLLAKDAFDSSGMPFAIEAEHSFSDVGGTEAATDASWAPNALFDAAIAWLQQMCKPQVNYNIEVSGCSQAPLPGQLIHVTARSSRNGVVLLDVDDSLFIMSSTLKVDNSGQQSWVLEVSSSDIWTPTDAGYIVNSLRQAQFQASHYQPAVSAQTAESVNGLALVSGSQLNVGSSGTLDLGGATVKGKASATDLGPVKVDGTTVQAAADGTLSVIGGSSAPAHHASTHISSGSDPIPDATTSQDGLMPPGAVTKLAQFSPTSGKTLTVSNSLTLAGADGKSLTLTGALTVAADTVINGGGTLALAGFTATVPATGTLAMRDVANTFTAANAFNGAISGNNTINLTGAGASSVGGALGVGQNTVQAWGSGYTNAEIGTGANYLVGAGSTGNEFIMAKNAYYDGTNWLRKGATYVSMYQQQTGVHTFRVATNGAAGSTITWTDALIINQSGIITIADGFNLVLQTTNGTKIGTATTQKLGFWGATPITRPTITGSKSSGAALISLLTQMATAGLILDSTTA